MPTKAESHVKPDDFATLYEGFNAPVSRFDCGRKCAPLNGGEPVCCSTQNAVPVVHKVEFDLLKTRTDLWSKFKPYDYATRQIVGRAHQRLHGDHIARARGTASATTAPSPAAASPSIPYLTRQKEFVGIGTYWVFEDRCWMMSNLEIVDRAFVDQFVATYEALFVKDPSEFKTYVDFSAAARRVYSRWKREIPLVGRTGELLIVAPSTGEIRTGKKKDYPKIAPFDSEKNYRAAVKERRRRGAEGRPASLVEGKPRRAATGCQAAWQWFVAGGPTFCALSATLPAPPAPDREKISIRARAEARASGANTRRGARKGQGGHHDARHSAPGAGQGT